MQQKNKGSGFNINTAILFVIVVSIGLVPIYLSKGKSVFQDKSVSGQPPSTLYYTTDKGTKIHYIMKGEGTPVLLIHGAKYTARTNWVASGIFPMLAENYKVIALDLSGYGESDKPSSAEAYGMQWVNDIKSLMASLNIQKAHIVGYSLGGMVAMKFISTHPDYIISGIIGGAGWLQQGSRIQTAWDRMKDPLSSGPAKLALTEEEIRAIKKPVTFIVGSRDNAKRSYIDPVSAIRTDWPLTVIENAGHGSTVTKQEFKDALVKWLSKH
jgi:pimeloyl-ACP methyl ester carboxylesterase